MQGNLTKLFNIMILGILMLSANIHAEEITIITGKVTGFMSKPVGQSVIRIESKMPEKNEEPNIINIDSDGYYKAALQLNKTYRITFSAPGHRSRTLSIYNDRAGKIEFNMQLGAYHYVEQFQNIKIYAYDVNTDKSIYYGAMDELADGTFEANFKSKIQKIKYFVGGAVPNNKVQGTSHDALEFDKSTDYYSVINRKDKNDNVVIVFDPKKIIRGNESFNYTINNASSVQEMTIRTSLYFDELNLKEEKASYAFQGDKQDFRFDDGLIDINRAINESKSLLEKQLLLVGFLKKLDKSLHELAISALNSIPPESWVWSTRPYSFFVAIYVSTNQKDLANYQSIYLEQFTKYNSLITQFINNNPERDRAAVMAYKLAQTYQDDGQIEQANKYIAQLDSQFSDVNEYAKYKKKLMEIPSSQIGNDMQSFSLASLDDPKIMLTNDTFKDKIYLLDFWGTWCAPCLREMPYLDEAYAKFHPKGFEILSISVDYTIEDLHDYRTKKWKMPWLHSYAGLNKEKQPEIIKKLEISSYPVSILVGSDGRILATDLKARGDNLLSTLEKVYSKMN